MGKRLTVRRMLKKRLSDSVNYLNHSGVDMDMADFFGNDSYSDKIKQNRENMKHDIKQLNYLLECLDDFDITK